MPPWMLSPMISLLCLPLMVWNRSCSRKEPSGQQRCSMELRQRWKTWGRLVWLDARSHPRFLQSTEVQLHQVITAQCHPQMSKRRTQVCGLFELEILVASALNHVITCHIRLELNIYSFCRLKFECCGWHWWDELQSHFPGFVQS